MRILIVTPMLPRPEAPAAIPVLLHAELTGLASRYDVTLVTVVGPEEEEIEALGNLSAMGVSVHTVQLRDLPGWARWRRRWRLASTWIRGSYPWRSIWFWQPAIQLIVDRLCQEGAFDVVQVEDNAMGIYRYPTDKPVVFTEYEVRRPRPFAWGSRPYSSRLRWLLSELLLLSDYDR